VITEAWPPLGQGTESLQHDFARAIAQASDGRFPVPHAPAYASLPLQHTPSSQSFSVHPFPDGVSAEQKRRHPPEYYELKSTKHFCLPKVESKPNPKVLLDIIEATRANGKRVAYVGDSKVKDVGMAQQAGVINVWAAYGESTSERSMSFCGK